jgi:hypothetical protein
LEGAVTPDLEILLKRAVRKFSNSELFAVFDPAKSSL